MKLTIPDDRQTAPTAPVGATTQTTSTGTVIGGASADRPPRPKTSRNVAAFVGLMGLFSLLAFLPGWFNDGLEWPQLLLPASQFAVGVSFFINYKMLLRKETAGAGS